MKSRMKKLEVNIVIIITIIITSVAVRFARAGLTLSAYLLDRLCRSVNPRNQSLPGRLSLNICKSKKRFLIINKYRFLYSGKIIIKRFLNNLQRQ